MKVEKFITLIKYQLLGRKIIYMGPVLHAM